MKLTHTYDIYGRTEPSVIYLAAPGRRILCAINGIDSSSVSIKLRTKDTAELSFSVNKYIDEGVISNAYAYIEEMMELYCDGIWFRITEPPKESTDGTKVTKDIVAESYEIVLSQYTLNNFEVNTGSAKSYEIQYRKEYDLNHPDNPNHDPDFTSGDYFQVKFCDKSNTKLSLLHLILKHSGAADIGWTVGYVDNITPDDDSAEKLTYLPDYVSNYTVNDKSVYSFLTQEVSNVCKCIFDFDCKKLQINVYRPKSLGKDTGIFLGFRNIQNNVEISRDDSLITQFYVSGLDDYNIDAANIGSSLITDLTYFMKKPYMSESMVQNYADYLDNRELWRQEYRNYAKYTAILRDKMTEIQNRVPVDSVSTDYFSFSMDDLQSAYTSNSAIITGLENTYVDDNNKFNINELKKHKDDWNLYESIKNYTIPAISAAIRYKISNGSTYDKDKDFIPSGNGNLLANPNPIILGTDWTPIGNSIGADNIKLENVDSSFYSQMGTDIYGITRMIYLNANKQRGTTGIIQKKINVISGKTYYISFYACPQKSYQFKDQERIYELRCYFDTTNCKDKYYKWILPNSQNKWRRIKFEFVPDANIIDVEFETVSSNYIICGMQLEEGDTCTPFGYYIQPSDVIKSYETNWDLYGIDELKVKIKTYENCVATLKKQGFDNPYSELSGQEEDYSNQMYHCYLEYQDLLSQAKESLDARRKEYDYYNNPGDGVLIEIDKTDDEGKVILDKDTQLPLKIKVPGITQMSSRQQDIIKYTELKNWGVESKDLDFNSVGKPFTSDELKIFQLLCRQASYSNENIITTSLTTPESSIRQQELLYKDAMDRLYIESHPQYIYSDTVENIYALPEFKEYHDKLNVNDYIYMGLNDENYVKLRVIEIDYNPCDLDEQMTITFSNMIKYQTSTNDYDSLLDSVINSSSYDGGKVEGVSKNADSSSYVISADIIQQMFSNPLFISKISSTASNGGSGQSLNMDNIITGFFSATKDKFYNMTSDSGFTQKLDEVYLTKEFIVNKLKSDSTDNDINKIFNPNISVTSTDSDVSIQNANIQKSNISGCNIDNIENLSVNEIASIESISEDAATIIGNCHTHEGLDQISTIMQDIKTLQEKVASLEDEISKLKGNTSTT